MFSCFLNSEKNFEMCDNDSYEEIFALVDRDDFIEPVCSRSLGRRGGRHSGPRTGG
jgi:hypothetical protein